MNIGIILAAGKGKRFKSGEFNKTTSDFVGKPLVRYATDLFSEVTDKIFVVVGVGADGVKKSIGDNLKISFVKQAKRMGTGHAVKIAVGEIIENKLLPNFVFVGYGDHMMFYTPEIVRRLSKALDSSDKVISIVTCEHDNPNLLAWGRVVRNKDGEVKAIVEQKEADERQKKIKELNAGFYCFRWEFLKENIFKLKKSLTTGEYYLTDMIGIAVKEGKEVIGVKVPFEYVGIGINTREELIESEKLYLKRLKL